MSKAIRYRKKPVTVDTMAWDGTAGCLEDLWAFTGGADQYGRAALEWDLDKGLRVWNSQEGDWIACPQGHSVVRGRLGEYYPVSPQAITETYDRLDGDGE